MKTYVKEINGVNIYKTRSQITISNNGMITYNPTEKMILKDGWVEYIPPVHIETLDEVKELMIKRIMSFDESAEVNVFYLNETPIWFDKTTRAGLMMRFQSEEALNIETTSLWYNNIQYSLELKAAIQMLNQIEVYAASCYDNTHRHLAKINNLETIEEVESYDYTVGYPKKLNF